jgi:hypothetical protein
MLPFQTENGMEAWENFSLKCLLFAHRANGSVSFVRLLTKKQTEQTKNDV